MHFSHGNHARDHVTVCGVLGGGIGTLHHVHTRLVSAALSGSSFFVWPRLSVPHVGYVLMAHGFGGPYGSLKVQHA